MPEVAFVISPGEQYPLRELVETLRYELDQQGVTSSLHEGNFPEPVLGRVYALVEPREYVRTHGEQALPDGSVLERTIFLSAERPGSAYTNDDVALLQRAGAVFDLDQRTVLDMRRLGIAARTLRPGYSKSRDHFDSDASRPIDVMFFGTHSFRRTEALSAAAGALSRLNCLLQIADGMPSYGDSSSFLGVSKWPLLAKTKVLINLHLAEQPHFEWLRALDAMHAGAVVVSEHASGIAPFVPGEHLLVASRESLPFVVEAALRDEKWLRRLREQAYERLSSWVPFALSVSVFRAAMVEVAGAPVPTGCSLGSAKAPPAATPPSDASTVEKKKDMDIASLTRELSDTRRRLIAISRQVSRLEASVQSAVGLPGQTRLLHQTPAWAARRLPRLAVMMVLHDDAEGIIPTLECLTLSQLRDFELVVVDAGSSDSSREVATGWIIRHPRIPALLVACGLDRGLGSARNIALEFVRAPYCLTLDPGENVYPRCLGVLASTLDSMPQMAFAYPMQAIKNASDAFIQAGGDHVTNFLGWDPRRLREGNFIHSPVLVRSDRLRELGGFTADPRLDGLEDYDMWCRIAERTWSGQLVPQLLAHRSGSASSALLSSMRPSAGSAMTALMERVPRLMAGAFSLS